MSVLKTLVGIFIIILAISILPSSVSAELGGNKRGPDPQLIGPRNMDLTVYRTVNALSCHPQNPLLGAYRYFPFNFKGEVPLMVSFNDAYKFNNIATPGFCVSMHMAEYPDLFKQEPVVLPTPQAGQPWPTAPAGQRPPIQWRHYVVMEFPNPAYDATVAQRPECKNGTITGSDKFKCGKWIHWEGMVFDANSSKSGATRETWHLFGYRNNWFGGIDAWNNVMKFNLTKKYTPTGSTTAQDILDFDDAGVNFKTCEGNNVDTLRRSGDVGLPCYIYSVSFNTDTTGDATNGKRVYWNPTHYTDIPHDKYGYTTTTDQSWVKCANKLPSNYFVQTISEDGNYDNDSGFSTKTPPPVFPVVPEGCDYPALTGNPSAPPLCLNQTQFAPGQTIPQSMEGCRGGITITATPTSDPNATPTPYKAHGDITTPNGVVNIADYNMLLTDMGGANTRSDVNSNTKIDIFDYNTLIRYFGSI